jgi:hypothetical protein
MASTVNIAFEEFLKDTVRLDSDQAATARKSRDNLIDKLNDFSGDSDFFNLVSNCHLKFGSFARKTKIRPLDDIDLMICISGEGRTYTQSDDTYYITGIDCDNSNNLLDDNTGYLNSTKVINRFIKKLASLSDYNKAEIHKNKEAATLKLKSYTWNFDIVPCWHMDIDKFLIPDGTGNWKLTDPRIDNQRTTDINQKHKENLLDIIRIMKYWNNRAITYTMGSYLLECMILEVYESKAEKDNYWVDLEFRDLLNTLSSKILGSVYDPKGIQGDLNTFSYTARLSISSALSSAYKKACEASSLEITDKDQKAAIKKWGEVLGYAFPDFS